MPSIQETIDALAYSRDEDEAKRRHLLHRFFDPLPGIDCALLNREDIARYVERTGMIHPFNPAKLKPASYEAQLGPEVLWWDEKGKKKHCENLAQRQAITLRHNSITYVGLNIRFRLPIYIAVRFNLTITHVHRGLLLGTGPLVDPGYDGRLMIPIHNLTPNDYVVRPGDDLVAIEFTKISDNSLWVSPVEEQPQNNERELLKNVKGPEKTFDSFISDTLPANIDSVKSSLGEFIGDAERQLKEMRNISRIISISAAAAILFGVVSVYSLVDQTHQYVTNTKTFTQSDIARLDAAIDSLSRRVSQNAETLHTVQMEDLKGEHPNSNGDPRFRLNRESSTMRPH